MPDLVTHLVATNLSVKLPSLFNNKVYKYFQEYRLLIFLVAIFTDLVSKFPRYISMTLYNFSTPLHSPIIVLIAAFIFTRFVYINEKRVSFYTLATFSMFHILVDNFQKGINPGYQIFFPLSLDRYSFNLISSEMYIYLAAIMLFVSVVIEFYFYRRNKKSTN
jgi:hypothetical protein